MKITARHLELAAADYFDYRRNLIIPNVSFGLSLNYEADLIIVTKDKYLYEVEIKISIADLKKDILKKKFSTNGQYKIKKFYYLIPESLLKYRDEILNLIRPEAGLMSAKYNNYKNRFEINLINMATINKKAEKISDKEYLHLCHLAAMRIWTLKEHLNNLNSKNEA